MTSTINFQDTTFEKNPKLGFYTVGDKVFFSKPQALIEATQTGHFPLWNFNNEIFGAQNLYIFCIHI